jgi:uncharacterized membrane protein YqhA
MERLIERTLIAARWLLAPLYLGLALLLAPALAWLDRLTAKAHEG